jgi:hypothetical protein
MPPGQPLQIQRQSPRPLVLVACVLVLAQMLLSFHQIEHLSHAAGDAGCEVCLTGGGLGAPLAARTAGLASVVQGLAPALTLDLPTAPVSCPFRPQVPRAPPHSLRSAS